jgi:hypothetical protein
MANLDFYALKDDLRQLFKFIFAETDIVAYELSSAFDQEARRFESLDQLEAAYNLGTYRAGYLQLWSPSIIKHPVIRRIALKIPGHTFRYAVEGAGLMQLYLDGLDKGVVYHTHFGHWNEAGARQRSVHSADDCNWRELSKISGKIQRHIRVKLAVGKLHACPGLSQAFDAVQHGARLSFGPDAYGAESEEIEISRATD